MKTFIALSIALLALFALSAVHADDTQQLRAIKNDIDWTDFKLEFCPCEVPKCCPTCPTCQKPCIKRIQPCPAIAIKCVAPEECPMYKCAVPQCPKYPFLEILNNARAIKKINEARDFVTSP